MEHYNKIDTLYKRGDDFKVMPGVYTRPEFADIRYWYVTEKVDGTSTIIQFTRDGFEIGGRTANAQLPHPVSDSLWDIAKFSRRWADGVMDRFSLSTLTVYGESYGPKINGGGNYSDEVEFRAFDIAADGLFLSPDQFFNSAQSLGISTVPDLGLKSLPEIVDLCRDGFNSAFAVRPVKAEGIIAKSPVELTNNAGKRLMFKIKTRDF